MGQAGVPYVIGFPSSYYYEFDLSGSFIPKYTATTVPERLDKQTVTFASAPGATIGVSDDEQAAAISKYTKNGFAYRPNYLTTEIATGDGYLLNDAGTAYDVTTAATTLLPFRPYFAKQTADVRTRSIVFGDADDTELGGDDDTLRPDGQAEGLIVKPGRHKIVVESRMNDTTEVRILLPTGITLTTFSIEPGEKVETRIINQGVYIVQTTDGKYNKKLAVR